MKIVKIQGGLGNQMLQYAFACKLKHLFPSEKILIDLTDFKGYDWHAYELDYVFGVKLPVANPFQILRFKLPLSSNSKYGKMIQGCFGRFFQRDIYIEERTNYFAYSKAPLQVSGPCYYDGTWFNEEYFKDIKDEMLKTFSFKRPLPPKMEGVKRNIANVNSVSIHVRRGNYLLFDAYKGICDKEYYEKAITYIKEHIEKPHFFIFSNDIKWCKDNLADLMNDFTFVENDDPQNNYVDMQLMSYCKHNIIAHSSFSWWGAWLNSNPDKIVVAPFKWVNSNDIKSKPQLNDWVLIEQTQPETV